MIIKRIHKAFTVHRDSPIAQDKLVLTAIKSRKEERIIFNLPRWLFSEEFRSVNLKIMSLESILKLPELLTLLGKLWDSWWSWLLNWLLSGEIKKKDLP